MILIVHFENRGYTKFLLNCFISLRDTNFQIHLNMEVSEYSKCIRFLFLFVIYWLPCMVRSETVAVRRRMIYGLDDIWRLYDNRGRMWPKFSDICVTVEGNPRKNLNQETEPTGDRTRARCVRSNDVNPRSQRWFCTYLTNYLGNMCTLARYMGRML